MRKLNPDAIYLEYANHESVKKALRDLHKAVHQDCFNMIYEFAEKFLADDLEKMGFVEAAKFLRLDKRTRRQLLNEVESKENGRNP